MFILRMSLIASLLLFWPAASHAEEKTCITQAEKEILVRNDDLWQIDQQRIKALQEKIAELESGGGISSKEIEILKYQVEIEQQRAVFYKEQIEARDKLHEMTMKAMNQVLEEQKISWWDRAMAKGGWIAILLTIGILIGIAL